MHDSFIIWNCLAAPQKMTSGGARCEIGYLAYGGTHEKKIATRSTMNRRLNMLAKWANNDGTALNETEPIHCENKSGRVRKPSFAPHAFVGHGREMLVGPWEPTQLHLPQLTPNMFFLGNGTNQYEDRTTPWSKKENQLPCIVERTMPVPTSFYEDK